MVLYLLCNVMCSVTVYLKVTYLSVQLKTGLS